MYSFEKIISTTAAWWRYSSVCRSPFSPVLASVKVTLQICCSLSPLWPQFYGFSFLFIHFFLFCQKDDPFPQIIENTKIDSVVHELNIRIKVTPTPASLKSLGKVQRSSRHPTEWSITELRCLIWSSYLCKTVSLCLRISQDPQTNRVFRMNEWMNECPLSSYMVDGTITAPSSMKCIFNCFIGTNTGIWIDLNLNSI